MGGAGTSGSCRGCRGGAPNVALTPCARRRGKRRAMYAWSVQQRILCCRKFPDCVSFFIKRRSRNKNKKTYDKAKLSHFPNRNMREFTFSANVVSSLSPAGDNIARLFSAATAARDGVRAGALPPRPCQGTEFPGPSAFYSIPCGHVSSLSPAGDNIARFFRCAAAHGVLGYVRGTLSP